MLNLTIRDSIFWISSNKGLLRAKLENNQLKMLPSILTNHIVTSVYFDRSDGVWISTLDAGVFYIQHSTMLDEVNYEKDNYTSDIISLNKLKNEIVFSTNLGEILTKKGKYKLDSNFPLVGMVRFVPYNNRLFIANVAVIDYKLREGAFGNAFFNWGGEVIQHNDKVYYVHYNRVICFDKKDNEKNGKVLYNSSNDFSKNGQLGLLFITVTGKEEVIVANKSELFYLKDEKLKSIYFPIRKKIDISFIEYDPFWGIIIGTTGDGIFTLKDNKIKRFNETKGLLNNRVNTLAIGLDGRIYVGMPNGMSIIKKNGEIGNFNKNYSMEVLDVNVKCLSASFPKIIPSLANSCN